METFVCGETDDKILFKLQIILLLCIEKLTVANIPRNIVIGKYR